MAKLYETLDEGEEDDNRSKDYPGYQTLPPGIINQQSLKEGVGQYQFDDKPIGECCEATKGQDGSEAAKHSAHCVAEKCHRPKAHSENTRRKQ